MNNVTKLQSSLFLSCCIVLSGSPSAATNHLFSATGEPSIKNGVTPYGCDIVITNESNETVIMSYTIKDRPSRKYELPNDQKLYSFNLYYADLPNENAYCHPGMNITMETMQGYRFFNQFVVSNEFIAIKPEMTQPPQNR